jgi:gamma-glutamylputrescine oxidase
MSHSLDLLHSNDQPCQHAPSWYADTVDTGKLRPQLKGDGTADICIVGAGFTGLSAALHLARAGYKVVVLEAHRAGWGASGRNGGQVGTGQRLDQDYLEENYGLEAARAYWQVAQDAKSLVRELIKAHSIPCHPVDGIIHADHRRRYLDHSKAYADKLNNTYDYDRIRFIDETEIREMVGSKAYYGGTLDTGAFHLHPLAFALGLAKAAENAGAVIREASQVTELVHGRRVRVRTAGGSVLADHVLLACNGYLGRLEPKIAQRVLPINNFVITTEPLSDDMRKSVLASKAAVADSKFVINYFRMTHDNRLLFGGGENYGYRFPADIKQFVRKPMLEIFPQLADTRIDHGWGGTLAITMKRLPLFDRINGNVLACTGYSGHGVALATLAGQIVAETINGQASRFDLMARLRTPVFPGGTLLRYPMLIAAMLWFSLRDKL